MNLKYQFYRAYYEGFDPRWFAGEMQQKLEEYNKSCFESVNNRIVNYKARKEVLDAWLFTKEQFGDDFRQILLKTTYPGLLSGTGYTHETGHVGEVKIGFYFDHTSGLPILPGHSVKGALRSVFPRAGAKLNSDEHKDVKRAKAEYILDLLGDAATSLPDDSDKRYRWVQKLEAQIFDGVYTDDGGTEVYSRRDIFLDAQIAQAAKSGCILGLDYITPHKEIWKNPIPLLFLKVLPGVSWAFSFLLYDTVIEGVEISVEKKLDLFENILLQQGAGAKTGVGYGRFESLRPQSFKQGQKLSGTIKQVDVGDNRVFIEIEGCPDVKSIQVPRKKIDRFHRGKSVLVEVKRVNEDGSIRAIGLAKE